ncbi:MULTISPECIES: hypothetical protein [Streptomyces]|uniref:Uncharacterized protein n=1 Tax=Streptomyces cremeus TaxID=66881 RepID=A0ABV5PEL5_STRCM
MSGIWIAVLAAVLVLAVNAVVKRLRRRRALYPDGAPRAASWAAGGAVLGTAAWQPGQDDDRDKHSSTSCGGCGGGCGGCGCGG